MIHDKLICPYCGAKQSSMKQSPISGDMICFKCRHVFPASSLRVSLEKSHAVKPSLRDIRRGYSSFDMTQKEKEILNNRLRDLREKHGRNICVDLNDPSIYPSAKEARRRKALIHKHFEMVEI